MNRKKVWIIFLPLIIAVKAVIIVFFIMTSAANDDAEITIVDEPVKFKAVKIPDSVSFAGETVPLDRFDVREALDRELLVNSYFHSQTIRFIKLAPRYFAIIEPILEEKGIPADFKYLAIAESGLDPRAVSPAGAVGLWQFLSGTARDFRLEVNGEIDERYHVERSTYAACDYMLDAFGKFGSWSMVAASYNAGLRGVDRQIQRQKNNYYYDMLFGEETSRYVFRIIALKLILENPGAYNFIVHEEEKYPIVPTYDVIVNGRIEDFADFAMERDINYKLLKDFNPWLRQNFLTNSHKKTYLIKIPILD